MIENEFDDVQPLPIFFGEGNLFLLSKPYFQKQTADYRGEYMLFAVFGLWNGSYVASGSIASIWDFGDEENVEKCIKVKCRYEVNIKMSMDDIRELYILDIEFKDLSGGVKQTIKINETVIYTDLRNATDFEHDEYEVNGNHQQHLEVPYNASKEFNPFKMKEKNHLNLQEQ